MCHLLTLYYLKTSVYARATCNVQTKLRFKLMLIFVAVYLNINFFSCLYNFAAFIHSKNVQGKFTEGLQLDHTFDSSPTIRSHVLLQTYN